MDWLYAVDWETVLRPDTPLLEIIARGSLIYLGLLFLLRLILKRHSVSMSDMLVVVLIADAAQNGMADDYRSVPDGLILVGTILFWNFALEWLGYHFPRFERMLHPPALMLVKDGQLVRPNMRREQITKVELMSLLREHGVQDLHQVKKAYLEGDGEVSVITYDQAEKGNETKPKRRPV